MRITRTRAVVAAVLAATLWSSGTGSASAADVPDDVAGIVEPTGTVDPPQDGVALESSPDPTSAGVDVPPTQPSADPAPVLDPAPVADPAPAVDPVPTEPPVLDQPAPAPAIDVFAFGCGGIATGQASITGVAAGAELSVVLEDGTTTSVLADADGVAVVTFFGLVSVDDDLAELVVGLPGGTQLSGSATIGSTCTAAGTVTVARDCALPDVVVATVDLTGLTDGPHAIGLVGTGSASGVALGSEIVTVTGGTLKATLPLESLFPLPLDAFEGLAFAVDGQLAAAVLVTVAHVPGCRTAPPVVPVPNPGTTVPAPGGSGSPGGSGGPVAPQQPVAPVVQAVQPTPVQAVRTPRAPAQHTPELAYTGVQAGGLAGWALGFVLVGGLALTVGRRRVTD